VLYKTYDEQRRAAQYETDFLKNRLNLLAVSGHDGLHIQLLNVESSNNSNSCGVYATGVRSVSNVGTLPA
jgi:hypothetical protein